MRIVVGISGASGMVYALTFLKALKEKEVETHLIISKPAEIIIKSELNLEKNDFFKYATKHYDVDDFASPIASGSQKFDAMVIIPCSWHQLQPYLRGTVVICC